MRPIVTHSRDVGLPGYATKLYEKAKENRTTEARGNRTIFRDEAYECVFIYLHKNGLKKDGKMWPKQQTALESREPEFA